MNSDGSGLAYEGGQSVKNLTTENNAVIILYAQWNINSYDVIYLLSANADPYAVQNYEYNQPISLPGEPEKEGYSFGGWFDVNSHTQWTNGTNMPAGTITVMAKWNIISYTITYHVNDGTEKIHTETYDFGETIEWLTLTRTGYDFGGWFTTQECVTQIKLTTMPSRDVDVYAKWDIKTYEISISSSENGTVTPSSNQTVEYNSTLTVYIDPDEGYHVKQIFVNDYRLNSIEMSDAIENGYTFANISDNHSIHVDFEINVYTINATCSGAGTINPSGVAEYQFNQTVNYVASPSIGYSIKAIYVDGTPLDVDFTGMMSYTYTFENINNNHTIRVEFSSSEYTICVTYEGEGQVSPDETFSANYGESKTVTFSPAEGHYISAIVIDDLDLTGTTLTSVINQGSYTFQEINRNRSIHIVFTAHVYKVTIKTDGEGTVTSDKDLDEVKHGEDRTINLNIDLDKYSVDVYINGIKINGFSDNTIALKNIDKDIVIEIKITKKSFFETKLGILIIVCACLFVVLVVVSVPTIRKIIRNKRLRVIK